jgi:hypothetical protein
VIASARSTGNRTSEGFGALNLADACERLGDLPGAIAALELRLRWEEESGHPEAAQHRERIAGLRSRLAAEQGAP